MCDFSNGFKLCLCENEPIKFREQEHFRKINGELVRIGSKKNKNIPLIYIWKLSKIVGKYEDFSMFGIYTFPEHNIGKGLNSEWILLNLNVENCFDFNYIPNEGDNLEIQTNENFGPYISFIYKNAEWILDHYDPFVYQLEEFKKGKIKEKY